MRHVSELDWRRLYRSRSGAVLGVCKGLAAFLDVPVAAVRAAVVVLTLFAGVWPMIAAYVVAGFCIKLEPALPPDSEAESDVCNAYQADRKAVLARLRERTQGLERRVRRLEDHVTSREFDFDRRLSRP
jgi:phage shock protein C